MTAEAKPVTELLSVNKEAAIEPQVREDSRMAMFKEVKRLQSLGKKPAWIAKNMKIAHQTATKYCAMDILPERKSKCRNGYYKYDAYVEDEYAKGKNLTEIYQEIKLMGFKGSRTSIAHKKPFDNRGQRNQV